MQQTGEYCKPVMIRGDCIVIVIVIVIVYS
jgi:hypothetical protein